jgi:DNA repair photolyase
MGCLYCFAYYAKANNPAMRGMKLRNTDPLNITEKNKHFHSYFYKNRFILHIGGLADPFCAFEKKFGVGYEMLEYLGKEKYPTLFSTKGGTLLNKKYLDFFERHAKNKNFSFQISITNADDKISKIVEPLVPISSKRIEMIRRLNDMGYWTILRLRPYLIGITNVSIQELLQRSLEAGIKAISMEYLCIDSRASAEAKKRYGVIGKVSNFGDTDYFDYFHKLSPSKRGGYLRLNRDVKEQYVREVYEFCVKNKILYCSSDPDFKEIGMSDCCCGLPEEYPENPEMTNYSKFQQTAMIRKARSIYWSDVKWGEENTHTITFNDVYPDVKGNDTFMGFMNDHYFSYDHPSIVGYSMGKRRGLTLREIIKASWNNIKSPSNPYNYFDGKVKPVDRDTEGNLVYVYVPSDYEVDWQKDGIDLSK